MYDALHKALDGHVKVYVTVTTNKTRTRGRPRGFDPEAAVATAQQHFHARGFDAVSVAELTEALGINPPSFYAAFGNKLGLYTRILDRWAATGAIPLADILRPDRPVAECLGAVLEDAARRYAAEPATGGCMVLEGTRCIDGEARAAARVFSVAAEEMIRRYVADRFPEEAERVTDFVVTTMSGLSAKARDGHGQDQLLATARLAGLALAQALPA